MCDQAQYCSKLWRENQPPVRQFVADIERYTLLIDHTVQANTLGLSGSARKLQGKVLVENNSGVCRRTPGACRRCARPVAAR